MEFKHSQMNTFELPLPYLVDESNYKDQFLPSYHRDWEEVFI